MGGRQRQHEHACVLPLLPLRLQLRLGWLPLKGAFPAPAAPKVLKGRWNCTTCRAARSSPFLHGARCRQFHRLPLHAFVPQLPGKYPTQNPAFV